MLLAPRSLLLVSAQASGPAERLYQQPQLPLTDRPRGRSLACIVRRIRSTFARVVASGNRAAASIPIWLLSDRTRRCDRTHLHPVSAAQTTALDLTRGIPANYLMQAVASATGHPRRGPRLWPFIVANA